MTESKRALPPLVSVVILCALSAALLRLLASAPTDADLMLLRFAGSGLRFQLAPVYGGDVAVFPLTPALLAVLSRILAMPTALWLLSSLAVGMAAFFLLNRGSWFVALAYIVGVLLAPAPATLIMVALALAALDAVRYRRWFLAGLLIGLAVLADPLGSVPGLLILISLVRGASWREARIYALPAVLIPAIILGGMVAAFHPLQIVNIAPGGIILVVPILAMVGLVRARRADDGNGILVAWSGLAALTALWTGGALPVAAILPGALALAASASPRGLVLIAALVDLGLHVILLPTPSNPAIDVGQWLGAHSDPGTLIATADLGAVGYANLNRPIIDLSQQLQPTAFDSTFFFRFAPDVITLREGAAVPWSGFATTYAKIYNAGDLNVYVRVNNWAPLQDHGVDVNLSAKLGRDDLRLVNVAIADTLHPGDLVRVRLDWTLANPANFPIDIKLDLLPGSGPGASTLDTIPKEMWRAGAVSTYHMLALPKDAAEGRIRLFINVGARAGTYNVLQIAEVEVKKGEQR